MTKVIMIKTCARCGSVESAERGGDFSPVLPQMVGWVAIHLPRDDAKGDAGHTDNLCPSCVDELRVWLRRTTGAINVADLADIVAEMHEDDVRALVIAFADTIAAQASGGDDDGDGDDDDDG